jgi:hypothetical protein
MAPRAVVNARAAPVFKLGLARENADGGARRAPQRLGRCRSCVQNDRLGAAASPCRHRRLRRASPRAAIDAMVA